MFTHCLITHTPEMIIPALKRLRVPHEYHAPALYLSVTGYRAGEIQEKVPGRIRRLRRNQDIRQLPGLIENRLSQNEFESILRTLRGSVICTIVSKTIPDMRKTGNPYIDQIYKLSIINGVINWSYQGAVNKQRLKESQPLDGEGLVEYFEPAPRQWGTRIPHTPLVEHKGRKYLEVKVENSRSEVRWILDDSTIDISLLEPFLRQPSKSNRQQIEKEVILRDYALENIIGVQLKGVFYTISSE